MKNVIQIHKTQYFILFLSSLILINTCISIENSKQIMLPNEMLSLDTTSTWYEFHLNGSKLKKETYAWISFITFKSKQAISLKQLNFKWAGKLLNTDKISASLYQKKENNNEPIIPIEENLICDGKWNQKKQEIVFHLNEKLVALNKYYLVLSFPENFKPKIKNGEFILKDNRSIKLEKLD
jgi:hypothetical protein